MSRPRRPTTTWMPYEDAKAWAMAQKITNRNDWYLRPLDSTWPTNVPRSPAQAYASDWKGWSEFLGASNHPHRSVTEQALRRGLDGILDIEPAHRSSLVFQDSQLGRKRTLRPDVMDTGRKILIEYDGNFYHRGKETADQRKNELYEMHGWTVVRIRVAPLTKIHPIFDLEVAVSNGRYAVMVNQVRAHLVALAKAGLIPNKGLVEKARQSVPATEHLFMGMGWSGWKTYAEAQQYAQQEGIKSRSQWREQTLGPWPTDIPKQPEYLYPDFVMRGGWGGFLGTGNIFHGVSAKSKPITQVKKQSKAQRKVVTGLRGSLRNELIEKLKAQRGLTRKKAAHQTETPKSTEG